MFQRSSGAKPFAVVGQLGAVPFMKDGREANIACGEKGSASVPRFACGEAERREPSLLSEEGRTGGRGAAWSIAAASGARL